MSPRRSPTTRSKTENWRWMSWHAGVKRALLLPLAPILSQVLLLPMALLLPLTMTTSAVQTKSSRRCSRHLPDDLVKTADDVYVRLHGTEH